MKKETALFELDQIRQEAESDGEYMQLVAPWAIIAVLVEYIGNKDVESAVNLIPH